MSEQNGEEEREEVGSIGAGGCSHPDNKDGRFGFSVGISHRYSRSTDFVLITADSDQSREFLFGAEQARALANLLLHAANEIDSHKTE